MQKHTITLHKKHTISSSFAACIGYFDGLHLGHMALLDETLRQASSKHIKSALITFFPDPWVTIKHIQDIKHLTTMEDRQRIAKEKGFDYFIILDFTKEMSNLSSSEFIDMLSLLPLETLVCGFDFKFGQFGKGDVQFLRQYDPSFSIVEVNEVEEEHQKISSTRIVECLESGNIEKANALLGYTYRVNGVVVDGRKQGRKIGYPTANIDYVSEYILPKPGVYVGEIEIELKRYHAMINIGHNPTFNIRDDLSLEVHILEFNQDIYGLRMQIYFYHRLRDEQKFESIDVLVQQLQKDVEATRSYFLK